ncbi:hypothetical protein CAC42_5701 [Sphaceloma murrayae]|uniref:Uncharacterized protein n=1 Tax=Sphaceloma murrayae TaxID=2082308 RepID=A0A2K1QYX3_9PEZI|nr:hypothetical protein CAC42_5701 [Sphaceloma murrayae]
MYARQTLQAIGPGRPCFRLLFRQCRRQQPLRLYSNGREDGGSKPETIEDVFGASRRQRAEEQSKQVQDLDESVNSWQGDDFANEISPEVEQERTAIRNASAQAAQPPTDEISPEVEQERAARRVASAQAAQPPTNAGPEAVQDHNNEEEETGQLDGSAITLSPEDQSLLEANPEAYLLIQQPSGTCIIRPRSELDTLGLPPDELATFNEQPDSIIFSTTSGQHTLYPTSLSPENEDEYDDDDPDFGQEADFEEDAEEVEADEEAIEEADTLQHDLNMLEQYDKADVTPIPFAPAQTSREAYLHSGLGAATISAKNFEGVIQDRIKALTESRQGTFRYAPDMAKRMMRGGLISFNSVEERDEVVAAAKDYAYKVRRSASKARKGEEGPGEWDFAPVSERTVGEMVGRYVRGRYWGMHGEGGEGNKVLDHVARAVAQNNTYLGRDGAVFMNKVKGLVTPQPRGGKGQQARK